MEVLLALHRGWQDSEDLGVWHGEARCRRSHRSPQQKGAVCAAGALLWVWEADPERDEPAGEKWLFLYPKRWNKHVQYAWRYDPCELGPQGCAQPPPAAPRVERCESDDEYLTDDEHMRDVCGTRTIFRKVGSLYTGLGMD